MSHNTKFPTKPSTTTRQLQERNGDHAAIAADPSLTDHANIRRRLDAFRDRPPWTFVGYHDTSMRNNLVNQENWLVVMARWNNGQYQQRVFRLNLMGHWVTTRNLHYNGSALDIEHNGVNFEIPDYENPTERQVQRFVWNYQNPGQEDRNPVPDTPPPPGSGDESGGDGPEQPPQEPVDGEVNEVQDLLRRLIESEAFGRQLHTQIEGIYHHNFVRAGGVEPGLVRRLRRRITDLKDQVRRGQGGRQGNESETVRSLRTQLRLVEASRNRLATQFRERDDERDTLDLEYRLRRGPEGRQGNEESEEQRLLRIQIRMLERSRDRLVERLAQRDRERETLEIDNEQLTVDNNRLREELEECQEHGRRLQQQLDRRLHITRSNDPDTESEELQQQQDQNSGSKECEESCPYRTQRNRLAAGIIDHQRYLAEQGVTLYGMPVGLEAVTRPIRSHTDFRTDDPYEVRACILRRQGLGNLFDDDTRYFHEEEDEVPQDGPDNVESGTGLGFGGTESTATGSIEIPSWVESMRQEQERREQERRERARTMAARNKAARAGKSLSKSRPSVSPNHSSPMSTPKPFSAKTIPKKTLPPRQNPFNRFKGTTNRFAAATMGLDAGRAGYDPRKKTKYA